MRLHKKELQWIYDNCDRLKQAVTAWDYAINCRAPFDDVVRKKAEREVHGLAFSFLMLAMGEQLPKSLWSVDDYSVLYGTIMDAEDIDVTNDA